MEQQQQQDSGNNRHTKARSNGSNGAKRVLKQCAIVAVAFCAGYHQGISRSNSMGSRSLRSYHDYYQQDNSNIAIAKTPRLYTKEDLEDRIKQRMKLFTQLQKKGERRVVTVGIDRVVEGAAGEQPVVQSTSTTRRNDSDRRIRTHRGGTRRTTTARNLETSNKSTDRLTKKSQQARDGEAKTRQLEKSNRSTDRLTKSTTTTTRKLGKSNRSTDRLTKDTKSNTQRSTRQRQRHGRRRRLQLLPTETKSFASTLSLVDRNQFVKLLDTGIPVEPSSRTNAKVLLLHSPDAVPPATVTNSEDDDDDPPSTTSHVPYIPNLKDAIQNCNHLSIVYTSATRPDQCVAIMGQYNSYHVHRFMRTGDEKSKRTVISAFHNNKRIINASQPLQQVPRGADTRYEFTTKTPTLTQTKQYWNTTLKEYLINLDLYLTELQPIVKRVALCKTVVVMVCNLGHIDLLRNFVCNAQAKGLGRFLSGILLFATDLETARIAKDELGLETYYNEQLFSRIPQQKANGFGDSTYGATIVSKVYCVQLVSMLGYHVLFNDVDLVWYRDPLEYFQSNKTSTSVDIYMSHDGNHEEFYAPYSGNTGFYYVRNTPRTQYFLNSLLVSGDLIAATKTHQAPFLQVLNEHVSLHGLRVKILPDDIFPGGLQFQNHRRYMKRFLLLTAPGSNDGQKQGNDENYHGRGTTTTTANPMLPYVLHMSWTKNKDQKIEFFQQLGEFYVNDHCLLDGTPTATNSSKDTTTTSIESAEDNDHASPTQQCCSAEPILKCHYSDRPSRIPCRDSPRFANGKSFW